MATLPQPADAESFSIVFDREVDGRWLAEVPELPGLWRMGKPSQTPRQRSPL
jgi:hypothetical protein